MKVNLTKVILEISAKILGIPQEYWAGQIAGSLRLVNTSDFPVDITGGGYSDMADIWNFAS
jgi:hypothetical protein